MLRLSLKCRVISLKLLGTRTLSVRSTDSSCILAMAEPQFFAEYAKQGRAKCKTCKEKIDKSILRIGRLVPNHFSDDGGMMKEWYHLTCMFDKLSRARATTKKIEHVDDLDGFDALNNDDKKSIRTAIADLEAKSTSPGAKKKKQTQLLFAPTATSSSKNTTRTKAEEAEPGSRDHGTAQSSGTDQHGSSSTSFASFCALCVKLFNEPSYNAKTAIVKTFLERVNSRQEDVYTVVKLLLPGAVKRVYNLQNKQLVKLFSQIFACSLEEMVEDLDQGDVSETVSKFFEESNGVNAAKKSTLTLHQVDSFLDKLSTLTKEDDQQSELAKMTKRCNAEDLKYVVRLVKHDLKINAGAKHVLEALDPDAYVAFHASHNLQDVVERCLRKKENDVPGLSRKLSIHTRVMTPVKPMLAEACKSFSSALKKCPNGMFAEIKYDGERVQVHKSGNEFKFFSRSLKPVIPHKVSEIKNYLPKACPHGNDLILDSEVLLVDHKTGQPLPFGTLGIHKKSAFKEASVCLFIFDCLQFNDENLMQKPMEERRELLERNVKEIENHVKLSETKLIHDTKELSNLMMKAIDEGLEGLVMKDVNGVYEPGKRHWLKMKKDYLEEGSMADTADLVVLGAYYGTGSKGGMMSVFLMGSYNNSTKQWCTVAKCGNGHDDNMLDKINKELKVIKISKDNSKVPSWLNVHKTLVPDFVVSNPKDAPVWEITGAEFSKSTTHTADGISVRFPRVTKIRHDKDWKTATNLEELKILFTASKETSSLTDVTVKDEPSEVGESSKESVETGTKGIKRKMGDTEGESGSRKKAKPTCKYGATCYQKSRKHREMFSHEENVEVKQEKTEDKKSDETLPCIFNKATFHICDDVKEKNKIRRYIIAIKARYGMVKEGSLDGLCATKRYNGDVVGDFEKGDATHIITNKNDASYTDTRVVKPGWVWDSIHEQCMLDEHDYTPP